MRRLLVVLALLASIAPVRASAQEPPPPTPRTTNRYTPLPEEDTLVSTRAGDVYTRIVRPKLPASLKAPVILTYTPYGALSSVDTDYVRKGYAVVLADVVGTGDSGGCWDYGGVRERASAYDLVEWLGTRAWSSGKVGMIGVSYDGTTANMAASERPPHLATIVPIAAISDWYGYAYEGGVRYFLMDPVQRQGLVLDEQGFDTPATFDFGYSLAPSGAGLPNRDPQRACADRLEHTIKGYSPAPNYDDFWRERNYRTNPPQVPALVIAGWRDYNVKHSESTRLFAALPGFKMLVMGQVAHGLPAEFDVERLEHAWFDYFLMGLETYVTQQAQSWSAANDGALRKDASWPPPGTADVTLPLGPGTATYVDDGLGTESRALATHAGGMLWYETADLTAPVRLSGAARLDLAATTLGTSTSFTPVLFDLGPGDAKNAQCTFLGTQDACTISRGFLNARYREGLEHGADLVFGEAYRARVPFIDNDWVVAAGHRFGLALMSSNVWWAVPDAERAVNSIDLAASSLVLPVVGGPAAAAAAGL